MRKLVGKGLVVGRGKDEQGVRERFVPAVWRRGEIGKASGYD